MVRTYHWTYNYFPYILVSLAIRPCYRGRSYYTIAVDLRIAIFGAISENAAQKMRAGNPALRGSVGAIIARGRMTFFTFANV